jgi:carboxyl-terminal processing protease
MFSKSSHFRTLQPFFTATLGALLLVGTSQVQASVPDVKYTSLAPQEIHQKTIQTIAKVLSIGHYRKREIDDELSSQVFDAYIKRLDNNRSYFLAAEIQSFERYRHVLDENLLSGNLNPAFDLFNQLQQRSFERLEYQLKLIDRGLDKLDFTRDESLENDRSNAPWPESKAALQDLWRKNLKNTVLNFKLTDKPLEEIEKLLSKRYRNQIKRIRQTNSDDAFQLFANAFTTAYGPHTQYLSPQRTESFNIDMSLSLEGIGAVLQSEFENTKIVRLIPAGPAEKTGQLHPSDIIIGVAQGDEGEMVDVIGWRLDEVVELIRGPKESIVRLEVLPANSDSRESKEIRIVRNRIKLEEQAAQKSIIELERKGEKHKLGIITIPTFYIDFAALQKGDSDYKSTTRDVEKLIKELLQEGVEGLIIDLRNNGGGSLKEAIDLAGLFIPQGPVVQIKDSRGHVQIKSDHDPKYFDAPLAIMVNRLSASASEIFAGAIKDYNRGILIGTPTFGKGTVQVMQPLDFGQLKLTQSKFYRISGDSTQNMGVHPDITLPSIYDPKEVGESTAENALPWDQVQPVRHLSYRDFSGKLNELDQAHQSRISQEIEFLLINEQIDRIKQRNHEQERSLKEVDLRQEREKNRAWQLDLENRRRTARSLPPLKSLSELDDETATPTDRTEPDPLIREGGEILLDLMNLAYRK